MIVPAPAPGTAAEPWIDNATTVRFVEWENLERQWETVRADKADQTFARAAATVCLKAASLPTEGEGRPGRRAALMQSACTDGLVAVLACYGETSVASDVWTVGFERPGALARDAVCGSVDVLAQLAALADPNRGAASTDALASRILADEFLSTLNATAGQRALALSACERVEALDAIVRAGPSAQRPDQALLNASSQEALARKWESLSAHTIRYLDVAAYHLAETKLSLYEDALLGATAPLDSGDLTALEHARQAFTCLRGYRDAKTLLAAVSHKLKTYRAVSAKEEACQNSPACLARREARARKQERLEYQVDSASQECCKVCRAGQACGDSCISRSKTCHVGPGCACDG